VQLFGGIEIVCSDVVVRGEHECAPAVQDQVRVGEQQLGVVERLVVAPECTQQSHPFGRLGQGQPHRKGVIFIHRTIMSCRGDKTCSAGLKQSSGAALDDCW